MLLEIFIRNVLVLYVGGTIGMKKNDDGVLVPSSTEFIPKLKSYPELHDPSVTSPSDNEDNELILPLYENFTVKYKVVQYDPLLDSSNMGPPDWIRIAKDIEKNYDYYDGFVILHGTDTLAYTASALSFMFEGLKKPVILTGAQISIFESRSDAIINIQHSLILSGCFKIPEVAIFFGNTLLRGNRATKVSLTDLNAFESPNYTPLATTEVGINVQWDKVLKPSALDFHVYTNLSTNIRVVPMFPTMTSAVLENYLQEPVKGVVLQTYGNGNIPSDQTELIEVLKRAVARKVLIINKSAVPEGSVSSIYETGKVLEDIGAIAGHDLTTEAALTKLTVVIGLSNFSYQDKVKIMKTSMRGELTEDS